jgi:integrase
MVWRQKGKKVWYGKLWIPTGWKDVSLGTRDRDTAEAMQRMLDELRHQRKWELLEAVADPDGTLTVGRLYDAYQRGTIDQVLEELADVDLAPKVADWQKAIKAVVHPQTAEQYLAQVRTLIPEGKPFLRSKATDEGLAKWLYGLPVKSPTQRRYFAAAQSFFRYLVAVKLIKRSPLADLDRPADGKARVRWISTADAIRVVRGNHGLYLQYSALLHGTGLEVSVGLVIRRRDVDVPKREVFAPGTKTHCRERIVRIADWAWPHFAPVLEGKHPDALLFPGLKRGAVAYQHRQVCKALKIVDYQLRDSRHTWTVRAARAGTPAEIIARQLGHVDAVMVHRIYGRFMPSQHDRDRWEQLATLQDQAEEGAK